jgi:hypothetical protein
MIEYGNTKAKKHGSYKEEKAMNIRRDGAISKEFCESLDKMLKKTAQPTPASYDDFGDGKYDHMGAAERIPIHAQKAEEFLAKGDKFNAASHAKAVLSLGAQGYIGTEPYRRAQEVLRQLGMEVPQ